MIKGFIVRPVVLKYSVVDQPFSFLLKLDGNRSRRGKAKILFCVINPPYTLLMGPTKGGP